MAGSDWQSYPVLSPKQSDKHCIVISDAPMGLQICLNILVQQHKNSSCIQIKRNSKYWQELQSKSRDAIKYNGICLPG